MVPWRDTDPYRARAFNRVIQHLQHILPGSVKVLPVDARADEVFSRAASRNMGVRLADRAGADVVVLCDADTLPEQSPLLAAIGAAGRDGRLHMPFTRFLGLTKDGTADYLNGRPVGECEVELDYAYSVGGVFVIRPDAWSAAGGMDERFQAWGGEDLALRRAADTLLGLTVTHLGTITHLWHPPAQRDGTPANDAVWALAARYADAEGDPEAMRSLIAERAAKV